MVSTIQHRFNIRKKHSLVLNSRESHHGGMNTNQNASKGRRFRTFMRYAWADQVAAHRALLRVPPYDDYLINRRGR
jgi:hypothetical protein